MNNRMREQEFWAIAKAVLVDALSRGVLSPHGEAMRGKYLTILRGNIPAEVKVSFLPPRPAGDLSPEAYLHWTLWPHEAGRHPKGYFNVAYRPHMGWCFYGHDEYRRVMARAADLTPLVEGAVA